MNSKFEKNSKKVQKNWIYLASKRLECTRCLQVLVIKWRTRRSREKNKIVHFSKFFWAKICFFLHELLRCPNTTKTCTHLAHLNIFSPTNFHNFLIFFLFFWICYSHAYKIYVFLWHELPECPNGMKMCTRLADMTIFDPTKFHIFLIFFAIFSGRSKTFDRTVTAEKGISISETNGGGAKLSIPKN